MNAQTQHTPDFTPGMWEACGPFVRTRITPDDRRGSQVAAIHPSVERPSWAAALMAAAPELYEAAQDALDWIADSIQRNAPGVEQDDPPVAQLRAALAKARGDA